MLFGNENKANDHTQQFIKGENKILPTSFQGRYKDTLGEFSNVSYSVFGAERVNSLPLFSLVLD